MPEMKELMDSFVKTTGEHGHEAGIEFLNGAIAAMNERSVISEEDAARLIGCNDD